MSDGAMYDMYDVYDVLTSGTTLSESIQWTESNPVDGEESGGRRERPWMESASSVGRSGSQRSRHDLKH
jgi:hypothetical protein